MYQVERISHSRNMRSTRSAPTRPNSPREIALIDFERKVPIHSDIASKSKVRQTEIFFSMVRAWFNPSIEAAEQRVSDRDFKSPLDVDSRPAKPRDVWRDRALYDPPDKVRQPECRPAVRYANIRSVPPSMANSRHLLEPSMSVG